MITQNEISRNFVGKWITSSDFCNLEPINVFHRNKDKIQILSLAPQNEHIIFRNWFKAEKEKRTNIYISADDYYKLYINGVFVCQGPAPGYPFHYYYNKVDITDYLKQGANLIAVHTYYQGLINRVWVSGDDRHGLILDIEQEDKIILSSNECFICTKHSGFEPLETVGYKTQFMERYVSGTKQEGFERLEYDDSDWIKASIRKNIDYTLYEQPSKMLDFEDIKPTLIWDEEGATVDFGAIYVGYLYAEAKGEKDSRIEILTGQELNEDGSIRFELRCNCIYREEWQLSGGSDVLNQFDYKSFRFVRLNIPKGTVVKNICLKARHYPFNLKATPIFKEDELFPIWKLCVNTLKYGVQEVIQDCMDREKGNYLGDGCYTALTHYALTKDPSMLKKLIDDSLRSSFINRGLVTCAACSYMQEIAEFPLMIYHMLVRYYEMSNDIEYLKKHYNALCDILDFYKENYSRGDGLLCNLDKWCVVEWPATYRGGYAADLPNGTVCTDMHIVINTHYIGALKCLNKIAEITNHEKYIDEQPIINSFFKVFYDWEKKLFRDKEDCEHISLIANVFPFMYALYPEEDTEQRIWELVEKNGFTSVMLFGAYPILEGLRRRGKKDLLYRCLREEGAWKRMLREGATTTFEGWGKDTKWNTSLFHLTLSYAALFMID